MRVSREAQFFRAWALWFGILQCLVGSCVSGWCQGFMVKPMKMMFAPRPGQEQTQVLELRNSVPEKPQALEISLVDITQGDGGAWQVAAPGADAPAHSCLKWLSVDTKEVNVASMQTAPIKVTVKAPFRARGAYAAGVIAQAKRDPNVQGIVAVVRFLIPVIVEVQGPPVRQNVRVVDASMVFVPESKPIPGMTYVRKFKPMPARTDVWVEVANAGDTYSRLKPSVRIAKYDGKNWRGVMAMDLREFSLLPGQAVKSAQELKRKLPSGEYQIVARLDVDGRPLPSITRQCAFAGDPTAGAVVSDATLMLDPERIECAGVPGAFRNTYITVRNPNQEPLKIICKMLEPDALKGVMLGETRGDAFSADAWSRVNPVEFTLRGNSERKIAVQFAFPGQGLDKPAYYANLDLAAFDAAGEPVCQREALVVAINQRVKPDPRMSGQSLGMAQTATSEYAVNTVFANIGDVALNPTCDGKLMSPNLLSTYKSFTLERAASLVLPLGTPRFNGALDFAGIEPETYLLMVTCQYGGAKPATQSFPVKVSDVDGQKQVEVIGEITRE